MSKKRKHPRARPVPRTSHETSQVQPAASQRYTPPARFSYHFRPGWHRGVAVVLLIGGLGLFVACEARLGNIHAYGGHIWYLVGLAIAASSTWWFGLFDPPP